MSKKILVVDDAMFMRLSIKKILESHGYEVVEAEDGRGAVDKYKRVKPDLVLMDITMPGMNGIKAVEEIRKEDPEALVVMCTSMGQEAMVVESIDAGARDFIKKPFEADKVLEVINKWIG